MSWARRDEAGFTLPELLVAITATAVVMPALTMAFVTGLRTTAGTAERLAASNDAEFISTYFVSDVQAAESLVATSDATCPAPAAGTRVFATKRTTSAGTVVTSFSYVASGSDQTLVRYVGVCADGDATSTSTVAHSLDPSALAAAFCDPGPCGPTTRQVSLTITDVSGLSYTVTATRRTT